MIGSKKPEQVMRGAVLRRRPEHQLHLPRDTFVEMLLMNATHLALPWMLEVGDWEGLGIAGNAAR